MKKGLLLLLAIYCSINICLSQQITTDTSGSLEDLISNNLAQGCVEISNISSIVNGQISNINSFGYFEKGNSNFPFENGIILSTGSVESGGNTVINNNLNEGTESWITDPDLENALGIEETLNATSVEFDFISVANQIQFNYLLASEEYFGTNPCSYSDGFAFLIRKTGSTDPYDNIALIPGTSTAVNTTTIHPFIPPDCVAVNEQYFAGYNFGDTNYNGRTTVLTATASIEPNVQYHIKLVIADQTDVNYDSAVFIEGNSFNANVDLGPDIATCAQTVELNGDISNNLTTYQWFLNNELIEGESGTTLTAEESGTYRVRISIELSDSECVIEDEVNITLNSEQSASAIPDFMLCDDTSNNGIESFDLNLHNNSVLSSVPYSTYNISYHYSESEAQSNSNSITNPIQNSANPETIYVRIEDVNTGCLAYSSFNLVVNSAPEFVEPTPVEVCDDEEADGITQIDLNLTSAEIINGNTNLYVSYHYSELDAQNGINAIYSPYTNINPTDTLYIRIFDVTTGCTSFSSVTVTVNTNPEIDFNNQWINYCEQDGDGFATFDLTSVIPSVLDGISGVTVTFHETEYDAHTGENPIDNVTDYENTVPDFQLIYIRVEDDITGCYSNSVLELHANVFGSAFSFASFYQCDDQSNNGIADFNLLEVIEHITQGYEPFDFVFYETEEDQQNETNPIVGNIYSVTNSTTLYVTIGGGDCVHYSTITLSVIPPVAIDPVYYVDYCDSNSDGYESIFLETFNDVVSEGVNPVNVKYYLTEEDAINNENILSPYYNNLTNPQTAYVRVTNPQTECYDIAEIEITVTTAPVLFQPSNIVVCDDDNDGINFVNLEDTLSETYNQLDEVTATFHLDYNDALNGENPIENPSNYETSSTVVYTRIENNTTNCSSLVGFYVYINTIPEIIDVSNFENCEADISGVADYYFYEKDTEILNNQAGKEVHYFVTEQDAIDNINEIYKYGAYQNTSSPQTIYYRIDNVTDSNCFATGSFELEVGSLPEYNTPSSFYICDDISNDGSEYIDLREKIIEIEDGIADNLTITFYTSYYDANNDFNQLPLDYYNTYNPQQIYARIENGTYCHAITSFEMTVIPAPFVNQANPIVVCDSDYDGLVTVDLTVTQVEILDVRVDNIEVSYHTTIDDVDQGLNPIDNPDSFTTTSNPQEVYVKVNNTLSNCYVTIPITVEVNLPPEINAFSSHEICDNEESYFDLDLINDIIVNDSNNIDFSYYSTILDANTKINELSRDYYYQTTNDAIFARVENSTTGCFYVHEFNLQVNPLPIANKPDNLLLCDDSSNNQSEEYNLALISQSVLGNQDSAEFEVTYFLDENSANTKTNILPENYEVTNLQTIFVRIENINTQCFSTTFFDVIIYEHANQPTTIIQCDDDYDGFTIFDLTQSESELYGTIPDYIEISYFRSEGDLIANTSAINNPENYGNTSQNQTIYIRAYNNLAQCYNILELDLVVNLPPTFNNFQVFETCYNENQLFNLDEINSTLLSDFTNISINYFASETDAENNENILDKVYNYTSDFDLLFVRIEYLDTGCYYIYPFNLKVNPLPIANQPSNLESCDDDYDGYKIFNLTDTYPEIYGNQNPNEFTITFYQTEAEAHNFVNPYQNTHNAYNNEQVFVRIENNSTGCYDLTSFNILVHTIPVFDINDVEVICLDELPLVVSAYTSDEDDYEWSTGAVTSEIEIDQGEFGYYWVKVTTPYGCNFTKHFSVVESEKASIDFTTTVDFADPNSITVEVSGIGNYEYILDDYYAQSHHVFNDVSPGLHTVTVRDLNGCTDATKDVIVIDAPKFFTPNGDGVFETWHIIGVEELVGTEIEIYDRFGKILKVLTHNSPGWDGIYIGKEMPETDYWFLAKVKNHKGEDFELRGHFSLIRKI